MGVVRSNTRGTRIMTWGTPSRNLAYSVLACYSSEGHLCVDTQDCSDVLPRICQRGLPLSRTVAGLTLTGLQPSPKPKVALILVLWIPEPHAIRTIKVHKLVVSEPKHVLTDLTGTQAARF